MVPIPFPSLRLQENTPSPSGPLVPIDYLSRGKAEANLYYDTNGQLYRRREVERILRNDPSSSSLIRQEHFGIGAAAGGLTLTVGGIAGMIIAPPLAIPIGVAAISSDLLALGAMGYAGGHWRAALEAYNEAHSEK